LERHATAYARPSSRPRTGKGPSFGALRQCRWVCRCFCRLSASCRVAALPAAEEVFKIVRKNRTESRISDRQAASGLLAVKHCSKASLTSLSDLQRAPVQPAWPPSRLNSCRASFRPFCFLQPHARAAAHFSPQWIRRRHYSSPGAR